ncbi:hypothetical protein [Paenibacillus sp. SI8]|uniref:hypothetical protein n=1 Tax=unclassified Paenibacillus TaxID=185978 RepID=UPI00346636BF
MATNPFKREFEIEADKLSWTLCDDLDHFELGETGAYPKVWRGREALYMDQMNAVILLRDEVKFKSFRLQAEVAIPEQVGFVGLVFGARDASNYELVYLAPEEIQYDPVMNGSMTWQIYNGSSYQKPLTTTTGEWRKLILEVQPDGAVVYLDDNTEPQLIISNLQHRGNGSKIGFWSYLPSYIRNLSVEEIEPAPIIRRGTDLNQLASEAFVTEWLISRPYLQGEQPTMEHNWAKVCVEENGTLNINRIYPAEQGIAVQVKSVFDFPEEKEALLAFGFSDGLRLWVNEEEVFAGNWNWNPPVSDGRIRTSFASVPIRWRAGSNTIRAEITNTEFFGWGLSVKLKEQHLCP